MEALVKLVQDPDSGATKIMPTSPQEVYHELEDKYKTGLQNGTFMTGQTVFFQACIRCPYLNKELGENGCPGIRFQPGYGAGDGKPFVQSRLMPGIFTDSRNKGPMNCLPAKAD